MKGAEYLELLSESLRANGNDVSATQLPLGHAIVGHQSERRLKWGALRIHLFTIAIDVRLASAETLDELRKAARLYAEETGGRSGFGQGLAVIPILVGDSATPEACDAVRREPSYGNLELPVIVDLQAGGRHWFSGQFTTGWVMKDWMRDQNAAALPRLEAATWTKRGARWYCLRHGLTACEQCPNNPASA